MDVETAVAAALCAVAYYNYAFIREKKVIKRRWKKRRWWMTAIHRNRTSETMEKQLSELIYEPSQINLEIIGDLVCGVRLNVACSCYNCHFVVTDVVETVVAVTEFVETVVAVTEVVETVVAVTDVVEMVVAVVDVETVVVVAAVVVLETVTYNMIMLG
ncbi:unnamed protein product, partial [Brenthis ino]